VPSVPRLTGGDPVSVTDRSQNLRIRRYQDADHDAVWALHNDALEDVGAHGGAGPWEDDLHAVRRVYLEQRGEFVVGLLEDQLVAMGALRRTSAHRAEIKRMRVAPHAQRSGFGRLILSHLELRARQLGYTHLHLDTTAGQLAAQALYRRHGYRETGRERRGPFQLIFFEKSLTPHDGNK
jgi:ribosomal protein S18 acetylase RimI-like enzyme